ncbi:MAG: hypothetical protein KJN64_03940 [Ignavibacteria bacterium]|nr:hypothetical protein [Ignavibacteria bacterium]MBT8383248.1 hypothetical protein [Ignavibacteria bacterium]MBT8390353.1 hypothetical protein [Ignavibacteria bacterium]NNJ53387.1 hypothetical protein [Ignavibacteriaceae bacterium]NNL21598.1 hypothetical protein [Ignavibacteriaceae bacterium]
MKKIVLLLSFIVFNFNILAQVELKGSMGINFLSIPSLQDYINQNFAPSNSQLATFNSAVIFAGEIGTFVNNNFEVSLEVPYQIYSYTENIGLGQYELAYNLIPPSVLAYYVINGNGYNFKFGGGVGPRFVSVTEKKKWQGSEVSFSTIGFGGLLRIEGNTALSDNVYANIGVDLRYDVNGEPEDGSGNKLPNVVQNEVVNINTLSMGLRLGISYLIGGTN